jgi:hypothetical protein
MYIVYTETISPTGVGEGKIVLTSVPDRRVWEQQICLIFARNMINVIKNMCMCAAYLTCM